MAAITQNKFLTKLNQIEILLNSTFIDETNRNTHLASVAALKSRVGELKTNPELSNDLNTLETAVISEFKIDTYHDFFTKYYYAIKSSDAFDYGRLTAEIRNAPEEDKLSSILRFIAKFDEIREYLKTKEIINDDLSIKSVDISERQEKKLDKNVDEASFVIKSLESLKSDLENASNQQEYALALRKIDLELKKLDSTNRALKRLAKKHGSIAPHQRSVKVKSEELKEFRNKIVSSRIFYSRDINNKLQNLEDAYKLQLNATTTVEIFQAKRRIKLAEKAMYGKKLTRRRTEKIDDAILERKAIINRAQSTSVDGNHKYRKQLRRALKDLKAIDKKIIGRRNAKELYDKLENKSGHLIGGTTLTLPKQVVELTESIMAARR